MFGFSVTASFSFAVLVRRPWSVHFHQTRYSGESSQPSTRSEKLEKMAKGAPSPASRRAPCRGTSDNHPSVVRSSPRGRPLVIRKSSYCRQDVIRMSSGCRHKVIILSPQNHPNALILHDCRLKKRLKCRHLSSFRTWAPAEPCLYTQTNRRAARALIVSLFTMSKSTKKY